MFAGPASDAKGPQGRFNLADIRAAEAASGTQGIAAEAFAEPISPENVKKFGKKRGGHGNILAGGTTGATNGRR